MSRKVISLEELRFNPIRKQYDNGIEIYNLTEEMKKEIAKIIDKFSKDVDGKELQIEGKDVLLRILPICTNVYLEGMEDKVIQDILDNPSEELEDVIDEVSDMILRYFARFQKNIVNFSKLDKETQEKILGNAEKVEPTEEELAQIEEAKKLMEKYNIKD